MGRGKYDRAGIAYGAPGSTATRPTKPASSVTVIPMSMEEALALTSNRHQNQPQSQQVHHPAALHPGYHQPYMVPNNAGYTPNQQQHQYQPPMQQKTNYAPMPNQQYAAPPPQQHYAQAQQPMPPHQVGGWVDPTVQYAPAVPQYHPGMQQQQQQWPQQQYWPQHPPHGQGQQR